VIPPLCLLPEEEVLATVSFERGLLEVAATNKRVIKFQKGDGIWILDLPYHQIVSIGIGAKVKLGDLKLILIGILLLFLGNARCFFWDYAIIRRYKLLPRTNNFDLGIISQKK